MWVRLGRAMGRAFMFLSVVVWRVVIAKTGALPAIFAASAAAVLERPKRWSSAGGRGRNVTFTP